jgi:hypothetical protein
VREGSTVGPAEVRDALLALSVIPLAAAAGAALRIAEVSAGAASTVIDNSVLKGFVLALQRTWHERLGEVAGRDAVENLFDRLFERYDPTPLLLERIDINQIIAEHVDVEAIIGRIDVVALARDVIDELDLPEIVRESSRTMAAETVDGLRKQSMNADRLLSEMVDRLLRRKSSRFTTPGPAPHLGQAT